MIYIKESPGEWPLFMITMKVPPVPRSLARRFALAAVLFSLSSISSLLGAARADVAPSPGPALYAQQCAACHGVDGNGDGPAAVWLYPKPRDFGAAMFKVKSTPGQALPTDDDLLQTITRGMPGSSMPSFSYLSLQERQALVQHVKNLTIRTSASGEEVNAFEKARKAGAAELPVVVPPEPAVGVQQLALGREVYQRMQCTLCHGEMGAGDGPQVPTLRDAAGIPARPRDFNTGLFRGGHTGRDLYLRIHNGMPGTPMVPYGPEMLKPEERWALVHYVQSLRRTDVAVNDLLAPEDGTIRVAQFRTIPTEPMDPVWESLDPVRVPLNPLWPEPHQVYAVAVSAVTDGQRLAVLLQWRDELPQTSAIRVQDFQDAAALQFSLTGRYGFVGMGDADNPVNLWQWKASWQGEAEGRVNDMHSVYNSMHVDAYFPTNYNTALAAGNVLSQAHRSPVEDANARGFGSFQSQAMDQQNVSGKGLWHDGFWNVVFVRDLRSDHAEDVQFRADKAVPVAFAIWNGEQQDRNGRKMISNWYQLVLDSATAETARR